MRHSTPDARNTGETARLFARMPTVVQATGLGRSTIYRLVANGTFPAPVHLGPRTVAWRWSDLDRWSESRNDDAHRPLQRASSQGRAQPGKANP